MIRWYADNSELSGIWGAKIPDILFFGGIVVSETAQSELNSIIESVKVKYKPEADFPIKWNFRGLKKYYQDHQLNELFDVLLKDSDSWRSAIFQAASGVDFTIIVSLIKCHGKDSEVLKSTREAITQYVFSNALMRIGLHIKKLNPNRAEIFLDWPPEGQRNLFDEEYRSAYFMATTCNQQQGYYCGPLKGLRFSDSVFFSNMIECSLLQFSDMIVGAARELVEVSLGKKKDALGITLLKDVRNKLLGSPDNVVGRGIIISPKKGELYERVSSTISSLYK